MGDATKPAAQWLLIVSTKSRALFDYLSSSFRDVPTVQVILDRREGERRGRSAQTAAERRRSDRRVSRRDRFPLLGYALIRRDGAQGSERGGDDAQAKRVARDAGAHRTLVWPELRIEEPGRSRRR